MRSRWDGNIYLGIVYPKLFSHANSGEGPIIDTLSTLLHDPFFTAIEVTWIKNDDIRRQVRDMLKMSCAEILYNGAPPIRGMGINLCALDNGLRKKSIENFKHVIDEAYFLGAKILHCVSGDDPGPSNRAAAKENLIDSLRQLCQYAVGKAGEYTLTISLENSDRDFDRRALIGPTDETVELALEIAKDFENFGVLLDQGHLSLMKEVPAKSLEMAKDLLSHIHIGNCYSKDSTKPYFGDKHLPFGVPDSDIGVEELASFLRAVKNIGFFEKKCPTKLPVLSFEVGPMGNEPPELVIANVKRVFSQAWTLA
jgi:sugar phosphate isomerase/epimerase